MDADSSRRGNSNQWQLACPRCRCALERPHDNAGSCSVCGVVYRRQDGIWCFLSAEREQVFREFIAQYETVRAAEGRRVTDARHLRALPFCAPWRRRHYEWFIRSRSYRALVRQVIASHEKSSAARLRVLDLGSGLGWLAYRLSRRGHEVAAVDLSLNDNDGLGAHRHYDQDFLSLQAEFDCLPFLDESVDLVIYNAALHYAKDYVVTLTEALRILRKSGLVVVMDTPIYRDGSSGARMVEERDCVFQQRHGFKGTTAESFLTYDRLSELEAKLTLRWELYEPWYGVRWWLKPWVARLRGLREPARFKIAVARRAIGSA